jgi:hypothetical protein
MIHKTHGAFGGKLMPDIKIDNANLEEVTQDIDTIIEFCSKFGEDISHLLAQICDVYRIEDVDLMEGSNSYKKAIFLKVTTILTKLASAIDAGNNIKISNLSEKETIEINIDNYLPIFYVLSDLKSDYLTIIDIIYEKRYFSQQFIDGIHERLQFIISVPFERLRSIFRVVELKDEDDKHLDDMEGRTIN